MLSPVQLLKENSSKHSSNFSSAVDTRLSIAKLTTLENTEIFYEFDTIIHHGIQRIVKRLYVRDFNSDFDGVGWIMNEEIDECMICRKGFGFFVYKHHCRSCGNIVCDSCSPERAVIFELPEQGEQRICVLCFWGQDPVYASHTRPVKFRNPSDDLDDDVSSPPLANHFQTSIQTPVRTPSQSQTQTHPSSTPTLNFQRTDEQLPDEDDDPEDQDQEQEQPPPSPIPTRGRKESVQLSYDALYESQDHFDHEQSLQELLPVHLREERPSLSLSALRRGSVQDMLVQQEAFVKQVEEDRVRATMSERDDDLDSFLPRTTRESFSSDSTPSLPSLPSSDSKVKVKVSDSVLLALAASPNPLPLLPAFVIKTYLVGEREEAEEEGGRSKIFINVCLAPDLADISPSLSDPFPPYWLVLGSLDQTTDKDGSVSFVVDLALRLQAYENIRHQQSSMETLIQACLLAASDQLSLPLHPQYKLPKVRGNYKRSSNQPPPYLDGSSPSPLVMTLTSFHRVPPSPSTSSPRRTSRNSTSLSSPLPSLSLSPLPSMRTSIASPPSPPLPPSPSLPFPSDPLLDMEWARFLHSGEHVLAAGLVGKKNPMGFVLVRALVLTDRPSLFYVDPKAMEFKGEIEWTEPPSIQRVSSDLFDLITPSRSFRFSDREKGVDYWVEAINRARSLPIPPPPPSSSPSTLSSLPASDL